MHLHSFKLDFTQNYLFLFVLLLLGRFILQAIYIIPYNEAKLH